jgi:hypothetical protein
VVATHPTKISYHSGKKLFRKTIGKYRKSDGTIAPRDFWLGPEQVKATYVAARAAAILEAGPRAVRPALGRHP